MTATHTQRALTAAMCHPHDYIIINQSINQSKDFCRWLK